VIDAALASEAKPNSFLVDRDVPVAHRRQAERPIVLRILFVADPDEDRLEQSDDGGQDFPPRQPGELEIGGDSRPDPG